MTQAPSMPIQVLTTTSVTVTPRAGSASEILSGGTAVVVAVGPLTGGYIVNPTDAAAQGIATAEGLYVDPVAAPVAIDAGANGTTTLLAPGGSYTIPPLASGCELWVNAATSGHKFTIVVW